MEVVAETGTLTNFDAIVPEIGVTPDIDEMMAIGKNFSFMSGQVISECVIQEPISLFKQSIECVRHWAVEFVVFE